MIFKRQLTLFAHSKYQKKKDDMKTFEKLYALFFCLIYAGVCGNPDAKRLYDNLLRKNGYNKLIRPVGNNTDKLTVRLGLRLSQLIDVVSSSNTLI